MYDLCEVNFPIMRSVELEKESEALNWKTPHRYHTVVYEDRVHKSFRLKLRLLYQQTCA